VEVANRHYKTDLKKNFDRSIQQNRQTRKRYALEKASDSFIMAVPDIIKRCGKQTKVEVAESAVVQLVHRQRSASRAGWKKLFKLLSEDLQQLERSIGRDKFFDILRIKTCW